MTWIPDWGRQYGTEGIETPAGRVFMYRKGQRVRFYTSEGEQIGPEQSNVAPAIAYALTHGWRI